MSDTRIFESMAQAFVAEGTGTVFTLMGDMNLLWSTEVKAQGARLVHVRHEHAAVAMADAYARCTGSVGVASVTGGPGFTQIMTALTIAARGRVPLVVFAGDASTSAPFHIQHMDQGPLTVATGARYLPVRSPDRAVDCVREAFHYARSDPGPVVLCVPADVQTAIDEFPGGYVTSASTLPQAQCPEPEAGLAEQVAAWLSEAERPIILAGRGAMAREAEDAVTALADASGALLATSLPGKGLFSGHPYNLGIAGAFASPAARELFAQADLVVAFGASLGAYTTESGYLFPNARVVAVDIAPRGLWQGLRTADLHVRADAAAAARAVHARLPALRATPARFRTPEVADRLANTPYDPEKFDLAPGELDPREVAAAIDRLIPDDWDIVFGGGHCFNFVVPAMQGRSAGRYHPFTDFGAIGQSLCAAIGIAAARGNGKVVLFQGDGSLLMHIQELETARRHGIKLLVCALNDGAYGSEVHLLAAQGRETSEAVFGRPDLAAIARAFGLRGTNVARLDQLQQAFADYARGECAELWDIPIACFPSAQYRRVHFGKHG